MANFHYFCPLNLKRMPAKRKIKQDLNKKGDLRRTHTVVFSLNELEWRSFNLYVKRFNVENKAKFIRETVMHRVIDRLQEENPGLFD